MIAFLISVLYALLLNSYIQDNDTTQKLKQEWTKKLPALREKRAKEIELEVDKLIDSYKSSLMQQKKVYETELKRSKSQLERKLVTERYKEESGKTKEQLDKAMASKAKIKDQVRMWEPASAPEEFTINWFGKLGYGDAKNPLVCKVCFVIDENSVVLRNGTTEFFYTGKSTAGMTVGKLTDIDGFAMIKGSKVIAGSNYYVVEAVK